MSSSSPSSRRAFLRTLGQLGLLGGPVAAARPAFTLGLAGLGAMAAQSSSAAQLDRPDRALVCLFMNGGNDAHNWLVPLDSAEHAAYTRARGDLALPASALLEIASRSQQAGRRFGLARELQPLSTWYGRGRCAFVANVGPLSQPTTLADVQAGRGLPAKLYSHNDQQATWQSLQPEGIARIGWGGRMADLLASANQNTVLTTISASGQAIFLNGSGVQPYQIDPEGLVDVRALQSGAWLHGSAGAQARLEALLRSNGSTDLQAEHARVTRRALDTAAQLRGALAGTPELPLGAVTLTDGSRLDLAKDPLARQLRMVARLIAAAPALGLRRQVFMVSIGGFDTHAQQAARHPLLGARVAHAVDAFLNGLQGLGRLDDVLLFSASDFGRTLTSNGSGSDHGWGGHHFVAGGGIRGGDILGRFPTVALGTSTDVGSGRLLPTTSLTEYAASLGRWMGLSPSELLTVLPGLERFATAGPDLGGG